MLGTTDTIMDDKRNDHFVSFLFIQPETTMENDVCTIPWDFNIEIDHVIQVRRPDLVVA